MTGKRPVYARVIFAVCFLALMISLGVSAIFAFAKRHLETDSPEIFLKADAPVVKTFKELYPFDVGADEAKAPEATEAHDLLSFIRAYRNAFSRNRSFIEGDFAKRNLLLNYIYRFYMEYEKTKVVLIENGNFPIIRLANGHLTYGYSRTQKSWESVREWNMWLKKRNVTFMQLLPATKMDDSITVFPFGIFRGYAATMEQYKVFLTENQIPYMEAKTVLLAKNNDFYSWFYKTDHHWNVFAGRLIAEATAKKLKDEFGIAADVDAVKEKNFKLIRYPAIFMGRMAFKAGEPPEDFEIFYRRKESRFHLKIPSLRLDGVGDFNDVLIARPYLNLPNSYCCFLYGDHPLIQIENKDCPNGTRVLIVKLSQADVVCTYLACTVQYLDIIDPRKFDGSIKSFIEKTEPDVVLLCI